MRDWGSSTNRPTTVKSRVTADGHQLLRFDREMTEKIAPAYERRIHNAILSFLRFDAIIVSDYAKGLITPTVINAIRSKADEDECPLVVDPKLRSFRDWRGATVLKPNEKEAREMGIVIEDEWVTDRVARDYGVDCMLITRGAKGMLLMPQQEPVIEIPAVAREVFDVSGAGDCVAAVLGCRLAEGASIEEAAIEANRAASHAVAHLGTYIVKPEDLT